MYRNIIGQSIFQLIIFCSLLFYFRFDHVVYDFIYEDTEDCNWFINAEQVFRDQYINGKDQSTQIYKDALDYLEKDRGYECGYKTNDLPAKFTLLNTKDLEKYKITGDNDPEKNPGMSRHYAFLFNTYVFLQIFNEINAKKLLPNENNIFSGLFNNGFFLSVLLISMAFQVGFVQIKPIANVMKMNPLSFTQYMISVGIGASCLIWGNTTFK